MLGGGADNFNITGQGAGGQNFGLPDSIGQYTTSMVQKALQPITGADPNGAQAPGGIHFSQGDFMTSALGKRNILGGGKSKGGLLNVF